MIDIKKLPRSQREIVVTITHSEWEKYKDPALAKIAKNIKVEGFRQGKVPKEVVENHIGKESILFESAEMAMRKSWEKILKEENLEAIGSPQAEILTMNEGEDLRYKMTVSVMPEVKLSKKWKEVISKKNTKKEILTMTEQEIEEETKKETERLCESRAKLVTVDRKAQTGDSVQVDFQVTIGGIPIEGGTAKKHTLVLGSGTFIPGFEDAIIGLGVGENKIFELTFPKEYHNKNIAGKKASFDVTMQLIQEREIPKFDDTFAVSLGRFETAEALKKSIADGVKKEQEEKVKEKNRIQIIDTILEQAETEVPDILVEEEMENMLHDFEHRISSMGMPFEEYLVQVKKTREELRESFKIAGEKRVRANVIFSEIGKQENIDPSSEEVQQRMNEILSRYGEVKEIEKKIDMQRLFVASKGEIIQERIWELLEKL